MSNPIEWFRQLDFDVEQYLRKHGIESDYMRKVIIGVYTALRQKAEELGEKSELVKVVAGDLYEAQQLGVFEELFGYYMLALLSICKKEKRFVKDPACEPIRNIEVLLKAESMKRAAELTSFRKRLKEVATETKRVKRDYQKLSKMYDRYLETIGARAKRRRRWFFF